MAGITDVKASSISEDTFAHGNCSLKKNTGIQSMLQNLENLCGSFKERIREKMSWQIKFSDDMFLATNVHICQQQGHRQGFTHRSAKKNSHLFNRLIVSPQILIMQIHFSSLMPHLPGKWTSEHMKEELPRLYLLLLPIFKKLLA